MIAIHLHNLLTAKVMVLFVNNRETTTNEFGSMMENLCFIFTCVCKQQLSLSASKTSLFQTEAIFAGATIRLKEITPDLSKLTTIVEWTTPPNILALSWFLGLIGHFRDLI